MSLTEQSIEVLRHENPNHAFVFRETKSYRDGPVVPDELERLADQVSRCESVVTPERACVVFGRGSQTRSVYRELSQSASIRILWQGSFMPWWLSPLALIAAAHGGLLQATDRSEAKRAVMLLANLAAVELYSFRVDLLDGVVEHVRQAKWRAHIGSRIAVDPGYFCLGVDGDSSDSATGIFAWVSYGPTCPDDLKAAVA